MGPLPRNRFPSEGNMSTRFHLTRRTWGVLTAATVLAIGIAIPATATVRQAAPAQIDLPGTTFNATDGDLTVEPPETDWNTPAPNLTIDCDLASKLPNNNAGCFQALGQPVPTADTSFGQGTKSDNANVTLVTGSIPPNKSDLSRFYTGSEFVNNSNFLYLAWERANTPGSANINFEINQKAQTLTASSQGSATLNRTAGDMDHHRCHEPVRREQQPALLGEPGDSGRQCRRGLCQLDHGERLRPATVGSGQPGAERIRRGGHQPDRRRGVPCRHVQGVRQRHDEQPCIVVLRCRA